MEIAIAMTLIGVGIFWGCVQLLVSVWHRLNADRADEAERQARQIAYLAQQADAEAARAERAEQYARDLDGRYSQLEMWARRVLGW